MFFVFDYAKKLSKPNFTMNSSIITNVCLCSVSLNHLANLCSSSGCNYKYKCRWESSPHWKPSKGKGGINVTYNVVTTGNIFLFLFFSF